MKNFEIAVPIHSFIDVVTNSSTSIFVGCHGNTIKYAKELIDSILRVAGSDKRAEELFEFQIVADKESEIERISEELSEYYPEDEVKDLTWQQESELAEAVYNKMISGEIDPRENFGKNYDDYDTRTLLIKSKGDSKMSIDLGEKLESIFSVEASYC